MSDDVLVGDLLAGDDGKAREKRLRLHAAVRLDDAHDQVDPVPKLLLGRAQHGEGLADPRAHPEEHLQLAALGALLLAVQRGEEGVGIRAIVGHGPWRL